MTVGIDKIAFFAPDTYVDLTDLAQARDVDPNKYLIGIGQSEQTVVPVTQDAVTMAANAASKLLTETDRQALGMVLFGTESGVDHSKSAAVYLRSLLDLPASIRTVELKHACYGATAGLMMAKDYVALHPEKKVLVIGSDIARYGLNTPGEVTQGGGAVAMLVSQNARILALEDDSVVKSEDAMDFWRPLYRKEALVDGHASENIYIDFFTAVFDDYQKLTGRTIEDFDALSFHLPFTKMGLKAVRAVLPQANDLKQQRLLEAFEASRVYNRRVGNLYTGSLYLSLMSLLANGELPAGSRIGLFSYGSGAEGEFFAGQLMPDFDPQALQADFAQFFGQRRRVSVPTYERLFNQSLPDHDVLLDTKADSARFVLRGITHDQRQYQDRTKA
ncbi:hydroxymethylglutaryl-CoA synthase [uncultured Secundilactobacillus sp.]|uniref:hydroxymethylglutaryl-CoA synthase n=1 Tax=uncultured Secundilactobacillus sp. TaxID=2813935 RepID=UPI00258B5D7C|nr:hydroxymethylglutaryl-CoA synthase [uncultured Secundilactobacillus sp.]